MTTAPAHVANAARERIRQSMDLIRRSLTAIADGRPGDAEPDLARRAAVLQRRLGMARVDAASVAPAAGPEKTWGKTIDFVDYVFLERGMRAGRAVARVATREGAGFGTGFMVSPRLFITNNHVLPDAAAARDLVVEFEFERDVRGARKVTTQFALAPQLCFVTNHEDDLDYTVVAIGERLGGPGVLGTYGYVPISGARDKHALGDHANIIQHPDGRLKEAVLRENQLVARAKTALHYVADTEPGSSGSPVFNVRWEVIALHHWGGPHRDLVDVDGQPLAKTVNEGIRISAIVGDLSTRKNTLASPARDFITEALALGLEPDAAPIATPGALDTPAASAHVSADGVATWTIPLRVSIQLGGLAAAATTIGTTTTAITTVPLGSEPLAPVLDAVSERALVLDDDYASRSGYDPTFLEGHPISLPMLRTEAAREAAAINREAAPGRSRHELPYEHFSVVMNGRRRLAYFTATNIDGRLAKNYDRKTGTISDPHVDDGDEEAAEASELWFADGRIGETEQTPPRLFERQTTFDGDGQPLDRRGNAHRNRMFQQGHLTRRQDPLWGDDGVVVRANADTFHVTNRAPQVGFFNMGARKADAEAGDHAGGLLHWRALEDYVLNNAVAEKAHVTVFTGPIFDDRNDIPWERGMPGMRGFKAPREFWKVIVRVEGGRLRATALCADQSPLIDHVPEATMTDAELRRVSFEQVRRYHVSIAQLEARTDIDFGDAVRAADTHPGGEPREVRSLADLLGTPAPPPNPGSGEDDTTTALAAHKRPHPKLGNGDRATRASRR